MFGNKQEKIYRLQRLVKQLQEHPDGLSQTELARRLGVPSSTIARDLPLLEDYRILLQEDAGKLSLYQTSVSKFASSSEVRKQHPFV